MLTPELYRHLTLKKNPVVFFQAKFAPPESAYDKIEKLGKSFFRELPDVTYRSVYGVSGDCLFYRSGEDQIKREAIAPSRRWVRNMDLSGCSETIYAEDLSKDVVRDLFSRVKPGHLPNNPDYFEERLTDYCELPVDEKRDTDGMSLAELISVFGSEPLNIRPANLIVLFLTDMNAIDITWYRAVIEKDIRILVMHS